MITICAYRIVFRRKKFSNFCCIENIFILNISIQTYGCSDSPKKFCGGKDDDVQISMSIESKLFSSYDANSFKLRIYNPVKTDCKYM